jgi:hypothetical protein
MKQKLGAIKEGTELGDEFFDYISKSKWIDNDGNLQYMNLPNNQKWWLICQELADIALKTKIRTIIEVIK